MKENELYLSRTTSESFLNSIVNSRVRKMIKSYYSRVRVNHVKADYVEIFYCDYGLEDRIKLVAADATMSAYAGYKFLKMPHHLLLWPVFVYKCKLDNAQLHARLNKYALDENSFLDSNYVNEKLSSMNELLSEKSLRVSLLNEKALDATRESLVVDLKLAETNKSLIDAILDSALSEIGKKVFECVIVHINSVDDFYIQKEDEWTIARIDSLQEKIQQKVGNKELKQLERVEMNKLCVAHYDEDDQFYRFEN